MPLIEVEQGTDEWLAMRSGLVTASRMADVMAKLKSKNGMAADRRRYLMEVVVGRLTGLNPETYVSPAMQWGLDNEDLAKGAYEISTSSIIEPGGFAIHDKIKWFGASPDGLIGDDGLVEVKCPNSDTHIGYILSGEIPDDYKPQMWAEMACTNRSWCDFVSFDPRMPKNLRLFIRRFPRDEPMIAAVEMEVEQFLSEVEAMVEQLGHVGK